MCAVGGDARVVPLPAAPLPGRLPVRGRALHGRARGRRAAAARPAGAARRAPAPSAGTLPPPYSVLCTDRASLVPRNLLDDFILTPLFSKKTTSHRYS